jgi:hypothetical protein
MTTEIAEIIFDENITLFEALDQLQVPEIASQARETERRLDETQGQVRELGIVVDNNQAVNNTKFINVNTTLDMQEASLTIVSEQITQLITDNVTTNSRISQLALDVESSNQLVAVLTTEVNVATSQVATLNTTVTNVVTDLNNLSLQLALTNGRVTGLSNDLITTNGWVTDLRSRMASVENDVFQLEREYALVTPRLTALETFQRAAKAMPGCLTPTVKYKVMNTSSTNNWLRDMVPDGIYGVRMRLGEFYRCIFGGSYSYIKFVDPYNLMNNDSPPRDMAVPLGAGRIYYGNTTTGPLTMASVWMSVDNN